MHFELNDERIFIATGHQSFDPKQPSIIFVHGAGMNHLVWAIFTRYYAHNGYNVFTLDLPGHGCSQGQLRSSIESMSDWVVEVFHHFQLDSCRIVGHSMGSLVALETASRSDFKASHVALLGCAYPMVVGPPLLEAAKNNDPAAIDMMVIWGHDYGQQIGGNRVPGVRVMTLAKRWLESAAPGVLFNDLNACNEYLGAEAAMSALDMPVSMISGDKDRMTPAKVAEAVANSRENVTFRSVPDCGHGCMVERPEKTHRLLIDALSA